MSHTKELVWAANPGHRRFKLGDVAVTSLSDGYTRRVVEAGWIANAELDDVRATLTAVGLPTDVVPTQFTPMLVEAGGKRILIDAGFGDIGPPTVGQLEKNLASAGVAPDDIDLILITHFHSDHINGLRRQNGQLIFPNANIAVPAAEWNYWMDDSRMNAAPEAARANFVAVRRVFAPIAGDIRQLQAGEEAVPGISTLATPGHSPGHTSYMITSGAERLLIVGDACNNPLIFALRPDYQLSFDMNRTQAVETRRKLLAMAAAERLRLSFYHAAFPSIGYVAPEGDGYRWNSAES